MLEAYIGLKQVLLCSWQSIKIVYFATVRSTEQGMTLYSGTQLSDNKNVNLISIETLKIASANLEKQRKKFPVF